MKASRQVAVNDDDRRVLEQVARAPSTPQNVALRARIVLLSSEGRSTGSIVKALGTTYPTVTLWRNRFEQGGVQMVLKGAPRPGRPPRITAEEIARVVDITLHEKPAGATHWSTRTLAPVVGMSHHQVHRIWKAVGVQNVMRPTRTRDAGRRGPGG